MPILVSAIGCSHIKSTTFNWLESATITERGVEHDREWVVVEGSMFVAQRHGTLPITLPKMVTNALGKLGLGIEVRTMCLISSRIDNGTLIIKAPDMPKLSVPLSVEGSEELVQVWKDKELSAIDQGATAAEWFTEFLSREREGNYRLMRMAPSCSRKSKRGGALQRFHDAYPFMVISEGSLGLLNQKLTTKGESPVPMNRFRPSIVLSGLEPHKEDHIALMRIGGVLLHGGTLCERCPVICTDQETAKRFPEPRRTLNVYRLPKHIGIEGTDKQVFFGRNFDHEHTGTIRVGDVGEVLKWD